MDRSELKALVEANLDRFRDALWLNNWNIGIDYGPCDEADSAGTCDLSDADYNRAVITLDPHVLHDQRDALRTLVHELLHIVLARYGLYRDVVCGLVPKELGDSVKNAELAAWTHAQEQTVLLLQDGIARHLWDFQPDDTEGTALTD